jgi:glycosyltransferase involved in cell wall biosynthesis
VISAVVVCRNARPFLEPCLASIRGQTRPPDEIVVVDGQSTDGSAEWLAEQPGLRVMAQTGRGLANARNEGIAAAHGEFVAFLDADDTWPPDKLARQLSFLAENPQVQAVTGMLRKTDDPDARLLVAMTPGGFLFRREVFAEIGLFDESLTVAADHEWLLRAVRRGLRYQALPDLVLIKRMHGENLSVLRKREYRAELMNLLRQS